MLYLRIYNSLEEKEKDNIIVSPTISFIKSSKQVIIDELHESQASFVDNVLVLQNVNIDNTTLILSNGSFINDVLIF